MLKVVYALLALLGAVLPWSFNLQFFNEAATPSMGYFVALCFANPASSSITIDLLIGATAFSVWMLAEARRLGIRHVWVYLLLTMFVAFAFAAPLFLFVRQQRLERHAAADH